MFITVLEHSFELLFLCLTILMTAQAIFNIRLRLFIWEKPEHAWLNHAPTNYSLPGLSFTILLPARHEEKVLSRDHRKSLQSQLPKRIDATDCYLSRR